MTSTPDVYFLALHEPYTDQQHPVPINATIVHAATLLHPALPQPDAGRIYRCLTEFPGRVAGSLVPLSTLTFELAGGALWPRIGDWEAVVDRLVGLTRAQGCDALRLGVPEVAAVLLSGGPNTRQVLQQAGGGQVILGASDRQLQLEELSGHVRAFVAQGPFWPGDGLVAPPHDPPVLPHLHR